MVVVLMQEYRPMVSVIVLTYNHEKYIKQALDSILRQKVNFDYEILIGDDASTDNTVKVLKEYKSKYPKIIKLFLNEVNLGATRNAYNLLVNAKGKYLATCEGDDYWTDDNKLQIQVEFLEKNKNLVGCSHYFTVVDENNEAYKKHLEWIKAKEIFTLDDFEGIYMPGQPATLLRKNLVYDNLVDLKYLINTHKMIGDRTLMLLWLLHGNFGFVKRYMSAYRINRKNRNSVTKVVYINHKNALEDDYDITCQMEKIAQIFSKKVNFKSFKRIIFAKTVYFFIVSKLQFSYFYLLKKFMKDEFYDYSYIIYLPWYFFKRLYYKLKKSCEIWMVTV